MWFSVIKIIERVRCERGSSVTEYALLAMLLVIAVVGAVTAVSGSAQIIYNAFGNAVNAAL